MDHTNEYRYKKPETNQTSPITPAIITVILIAVLGFFGYKIITTGPATTGGSSDDPQIGGSTSDPETLTVEYEESIIAKENYSCDNYTNSKYFKSLSTPRKWTLIGKEFTDDQKSLKITAQLSKSLDEIKGEQEELYIRAEVKGQPVKIDLLQEGDTNKYSGKLNLSSVSPGKYKVRAYTIGNCGYSYSNGKDTIVSYPMYVAWTLDHEGKSFPYAYLQNIDNIAKKHNNMPITHFYNPRTFITNAVSNQAAANHLKWVKARQKNHGDTIALHLHMYYDMVKAAGVEPQKVPRWGWPSDDGYDVLVSGYSYDELTKILKWSKKIFKQKGLPEPTMFRAGGWHATEDTLLVLEDNGFVVDSSGRDRFTSNYSTASLGDNNIPWPWLLEKTTQPYKPTYYSQNDMDGFGDEVMKIWEFPNNGLDSTAFKADQMWSFLKENYKNPGQPLKERRVMNYLSHPDYFNTDSPRIDALFGKIDPYLYDKDKGPIIYTDLDHLYDVYENKLDLY